MSSPRRPEAGAPGSGPASGTPAGHRASAGRWRCDAALRAGLAERLGRWERCELAPPGPAALRPAAVALVLLDAADGPGLPDVPRVDPGDAALLLTRRPEGLRRHAGQWALPGGRVEPGEAPLQAALRELHEEVGLRLGAEALLGRLDDYPTRSGFVITPFVFWAGPTGALQPDPQEVASLHRLPLAELMREDAPMLETTDQGPHPVLRMPVGDHWIAAPTAALLYQFREGALAGRPTRVAHFDQPAFAWR